MIFAKSNISWRSHSASSTKSIVNVKRFFLYPCPISSIHTLSLVGRRGRCKGYSTSQSTCHMIVQVTTTQRAVLPVGASVRWIHLTFNLSAWRNTDSGTLGFRVHSCIIRFSYFALLCIITLYSDNMELLLQHGFISTIHLW